MTGQKKSPKGCDIFRPIKRFKDDALKNNFVRINHSLRFMHNFGRRPKDRERDQII